MAASTFAQRNGSARPVFKDGGCSKGALDDAGNLATMLLGMTGIFTGGEDAEESVGKAGSLSMEISVWVVRNGLGL